ncbi:DUF1127 domain-containing protein [Salipiger sp.]|uniref:DUF1127 domain-containing protein n=1 Tax=Salipiger sp. TaxID=2078585 RepID=UPI003A97DDBB
MSLYAALPRYHAPRRPLLSRLLSLTGLARQRRHLAQLDDHLLADLGITRSEAQREAGRPFWDAPRHWTL